MKKSSIIILTIFVCCAVFFSCNKHDNTIVSPVSQCSSSDTTVYTKFINGFDLNPASPYYNQCVMNFKFIQTEITCPSNGSSTDLIIQNNTAQTISFSYSINFLLNAARWNYQNSVSIPASSYVDVGQINTNPARVDLAYITVQGTIIQYH